MAQLWGAIGAVFGSWMNPRAKPIVACRDIPASWGTAVQRPVDGVRQHGRHLGDRRRLHPQPLDRRERALRRVPDQCPGRGRRRRHPHAAEHHGARAHRGWVGQAVDGDGAAEGLRRVPAHDGLLLEATTATCRTWSSPSRRANSTCCRPAAGKRTAKAAIRVAVDMANDGLITREEAVQRVDPAALDQLLHPDHRSQSRAEDRRHRAAGVAGSGFRRDRLQLRGCRDGGRRRSPGDPCAGRDEPR